MRLVYFFLLMAPPFLSGSGMVCAQSKSSPELFPTYQQIKPTSTEITDYVPEQGDSLVTGRQKMINLFDYPECSVTYILNGKPTTDRKYVQKLVNTKGTQLKHIKIGQPTADDRLTIEIDYSNR